MRKTGMHSQGGFSFTDRTLHGKERYIVKVACAGAAEMRVRKSCYSAVGIEIARNSVPSGKPVVRTELNHTERNLRTGIGITREIRANHRIDIFRKVSPRFRRRCRIATFGGYRHSGTPKNEGQPRIKKTRHFFVCRIPATVAGAVCKSLFHGRERFGG